jgi:hypothetical protein
MVDFATLKRSSSNGVSKLNDQLKKMNTSENASAKDDRMWYPSVDKTGNGYAVIRFLPAPGGEDVPFVRVFEHGFKGQSTGLWYIEKSLTTIGQADPVSEYNTQLWNSTTDDASPARKQARDQKRKLTYVSNVFVVKDPANPENEGKVMLFKYGKKIFDKLNEAMNPAFADEEPTNPFDMWEGANFKIKIRNVAGYRNYDSSEFDVRGPLKRDDEQLEKIWKSEYSLQEFIDPKNFKDYDTLKRKLNSVLGLTAAAAERREVYEDAPATAEAPSFREAAAPKFAAKTAEDDVPWNTDEDDDDLSYFKKLASE